MDSKPIISVIIPAQRNSRLLVNLLSSLSLQDYPAHKYEILVVVGKNQGSVVQGLVRELGLTNASVVQQNGHGLSNARNEGIRRAGSDILAFIDDDAIPERNWLKELHMAHKLWNVDCIGGKVEVLWSKSKPDWLPNELLGYYAACDYSNKPKQLHKPEWLVGTNISFKRRIFGIIGLFRESLGRKYGTLASMEEVEFCQRIQKAGGVVMYSPHMVVRHLIQEERICVTYILRRAFWQGRSQARMDVICRSLHYISGSCLVEFGRTVCNLLRLTYGILVLDKKSLMLSISRIMETTGYFVEVAFNLLSKLLPRIFAEYGVINER